MASTFWEFHLWRQLMNRLHRKQGDFGVRQEVHTFLFALTTVILLLGMYLLTVHTPLQMDDYDYMFSWSTGRPLSGLRDIFESQKAHYMLWGGRSVTHTFVQSCLYLGKRTFNILNPFVYICLLIEIAILAGRRLRQFSWEAMLAAHLVLFFTVPFFGVAFFWLDGACNYLWGTAAALLPILIIRSRSQGGFFARKGAMVPAVLLMFLGGWTNENTACGILVAHGLLIIERHLRQKKVSAADLVLLLSEAAGVCIMLLAPGNRARASGYVYQNMVVEYGIRCVRVLYYALRYAFVPWVCFFIIIIRNKSARTFLIEHHFCLVAAVFSVLALIGSPEVSDRTYLGVIVLMITECLAYLDFRAAENTYPKVAFTVAAIALLCTGIGFFCAGRAVLKHETRWNRQLYRIEQAVEAEKASVTIDSVLSESPYTMSIQIEEEADAWPNSTLGKWFGIRVLGSGQTAE